MARITGTQAILKGPIKRDENLIAHSWYLVLVYGAIIGAIALLVWMFQAGAWSERQWPTQAPASVVYPQSPPAPAYHQREADQKPASSLEEKTNKFWDNTLRR